MRKKAEVGWGLILVLGIAAIFVIIVVLSFFSGSNSLFKLAAKGSDKIADSIMADLYIKEPIVKPSDNIPPEVAATFGGLAASLQKTTTSACYRLYPALPADMKGYKMVLVKTEKGTSLWLLNDKGQYADATPISGKSPCITNSKNFYDKYVLGKEITESDIQEANEIQILDNGEILVDGIHHNLNTQQSGFKDQKNILTLGTETHLDMIYATDDQHSCLMILGSQYMRQMYFSENSKLPYCDVPPEPKGNIVPEEQHEEP